MTDSKQISYPELKTKKNKSKKKTPKNTKTKTFTKFPAYMSFGEGLGIFVISKTKFSVYRLTPIPITTLQLLLGDIKNISFPRRILYLLK